jgi:two-component system NtrC family response regulator
MVALDCFREDLWFRVNTFEIRIPPLRERTGDIPLLGAHLARRFRPNVPSGVETFTPQALSALETHTWPGNVRELANVIEHATILSDQPPISVEDLPARLAGATQPASPVTLTGPQSLRKIEIQCIYDAIHRHGGSKPNAAKELGISLKTLYNKLNQAAALERSA